MDTNLTWFTKWSIILDENYTYILSELFKYPLFCLQKNNLRLLQNEGSFFPLGEGKNDPSNTFAKIYQFCYSI